MDNIQHWIIDLIKQICWFKHIYWHIREHSSPFSILRLIRDVDTFINVCLFSMCNDVIFAQNSTITTTTTNIFFVCLFYVVVVFLHCENVHLKPHIFQSNRIFKNLENIPFLLIPFNWFKEKCYFRFFPNQTRINTKKEFRQKKCVYYIYNMSVCLNF